MDSENLDISLLTEIEAHAVAIAQGAGQILLENFRKPIEVQFKDKNKSDPVTSADHHSEEYLKKAITERFPDHAILSEERGVLRKSDSPFVWVVDPLDGTANFINNLPLFAVSIGVLWKGQPVVGSIYTPVSHCATEGVYHACLGKGAFLNGKKIGVVTEPPEHPLSEIPVQFGNRFRLSGKNRIKPHEARNLGSIALELALTACGVFQYAFFGSPKIWDAAAGVLLVKESGGLVFTRRTKGRKWLQLEQFRSEKDNDGEILEYLRGWSAPLVVGAPEITEEVVKSIRTTRSPLSLLNTLRRPRGQKSGEQVTGDKKPPNSHHASH